MAGKQSATMTKVQNLIEGGMSAPNAARKHGVSIGSVYVRPWWKEMQKAKKLSESRMGLPQSFEE